MGAGNNKENYTFDKVVNWRCAQKILGSSQASSDSMQVPTFTRVLQGQEPRTLGSGDSDAENTHSSMMWRSKLEDFTTDDLAIRRVGSESWLHLLKNQLHFADGFSGLQGTGVYWTSRLSPGLSLRWSLCSWPT
ncbi:hypothetical protein SUGI_1171850 [Cryptomeria japonica]|uniref:auxin response factor 2A isoform X2 n=1 Tax=Cryptomeria japonica TaxID=3369 RepID=UPI0024146A6F|nr:auxin response factor 2A isoform X2 [Cryptomeria japonica]GLJ54560.1 hypothetical protein SUGI_1171850 [Cryptomeria japonica]